MDMSSLRHVWTCFWWKLDTRNKGIIVNVGMGEIDREGGERERDAKMKGYKKMLRSICEDNVEKNMKRRCTL